MEPFKNCVLKIGIEDEKDNVSTLIFNEAKS